MVPSLVYGGAEGTRTLYLIAASDALSQVSYDPVYKEYNRNTLYILKKSGQDYCPDSSDSSDTYSRMSPG